MGTGKIASQAGHAFIGAFLKSPTERQLEYHKDGIGTKVCLTCPNLEAMNKAYDAALSHGFPCAYIVDSGCANFFNGEPTPTALGIGPLTRQEAKFLKKFQLMK